MGSRTSWKGREWWSVLVVMDHASQLSQNRYCIRYRLRVLEVIVPTLPPPPGLYEG
jgi:hypothetical protein